MRQITYKEAIREATISVMQRDPSVILMGLGVPDPKGIFGTTIGLRQKFGADRVMETPTAENGMTGVAMGAALMGMKPIVTHQRVEFALLAIEQIINQAAKWSYMTDGKASVPIVIRLIVGRGWGQGPQHSQFLEPFFAHVPGLKVVTPASAADAKGLFISAVNDPGPVIFFEHRWLHETFGDVPVSDEVTKIGEAKIARHGKDITLVSSSYGVVECLAAADVLSHYGIEAEVLDLRSIRPIDENAIFNSVEKTGHILVVDNGWTHINVGSEIVARVSEKRFNLLKSPPRRLGLRDVPIPSTRALANLAYVSQAEIIDAVSEQIGLKLEIHWDKVTQIDDVPNREFKGPF